MKGKVLLALAVASSACFFTYKLITSRKIKVNTFENEKNHIDEKREDLFNDIIRLEIESSGQDFSGLLETTYKATENQISSTDLGMLVFSWTSRLEDEDKFTNLYKYWLEICEEEFDNNKIIINWYEFLVKNGVNRVDTKEVIITEDINMYYEISIEVNENLGKVVKPTKAYFEIGNIILEKGVLYL